MCWRAALLGLGLLAAAAPAAAEPCFAAGEFGRAVGVEPTLLYRAEFLWPWRGELVSGTRSVLKGYWEVSLGLWHGNHDLLDFGVTPLFRWAWRSAGPLGAPYLEAAVGAHLLSRVAMYDRCFSTAFQFGDHLALGTRFGPEGRFDLAYKLQHLSNGGIERPNSGMLFHIARLAMAF